MKHDHVILGRRGAKALARCVRYMNEIGNTPAVENLACDLTPPEVIEECAVLYGSLESVVAFILCTSTFYFVCVCGAVQR